MNVYRRYFRTSTGPLIRIVKRIKKENETAHEEYLAIIADIGASDRYYHRHHKLTALKFDSQPDLKRFKCVDNGWMPRRNTKAGRLLSDRFEAVQTVNPKKALEYIGINEFCLMGAGCIHVSHLTVIPKPRPVAYVFIPWRDVDPTEIKSYKARKPEDQDDMDMNHLIWEPPAGFAEVKEWQVQRDFDNWNSRTKEAA